MNVKPTDLVVNVFERSYRAAMAPGFFPSIEEQNLQRFNKILLINNVKEEDDVFALADSLVARNEIDEWYSVAQYLPKALEMTGLTLKSLGRIPYYSTAPLVAVAIHKNPFLLYWDADIHLSAPHNWIDAGQSLLNRDANIFCVNPRWTGNSVEEESVINSDGFAFGYGFSDQCFLVRRGTFSHPIYNYKCPTSFRYPLAHIAPDFEQMIDSFSRSKRLLRATYLNATYSHPNEGVSYPTPFFAERMHRLFGNMIIRLTQVLPTNNPCLKVNPKALA